MAEEIKETALVKIAPSNDIEVQTFYNGSLKAREYAEARVMATTEDLKPATDDLSMIAKIKKGMEEKRREYVQPLQEHVKAVNEAFKTLMEPIETADKITRDKILIYQQEQRRIREEQEAINQKRQEAAEAEMKLKGELSESVNLVEVTPEPVKRVSTDMGSTGMVDCWKYEVVDFYEIPREYLMVDTSQLNAIAKRHHDQKQVLGVRFYNEPIIAVRAR